jgi:hypothetical protein
MGTGKRDFGPWLRKRFSTTAPAFVWIGCPKGQRLSMSELLPGLPGQRELRFWVPPHPDGLVPKPSLEASDGSLIDATVAVRPLTRSGEPSRPIGYRVLASGLDPDRLYRLKVSFPGDPAVRTSAVVRTLPLRIGDHFTVAVGSCYSLSEDKRQIRQAYPPERFRFEESAIRLRFLTGDQVYLDLSPVTGDPSYLTPPDPWDVYRRHWNDPDYACFLAGTPTGYLADDHEFWNDFPHRSLWLTWSGGGMDNPVGRAANEAFELYQAALNPFPGEEGSLSDEGSGYCRSYSFDVLPVSFFALDTRTDRTHYTSPDAGLMRQEEGKKRDLDALRAWVERLEGPGILVISQPLVAEPASSAARFFHSMGDVNLPDYGEDYGDVWHAVLGSRHNILVLTGDIHSSRVTLVQPVSVPGASGKSAFELVSSPLVHIKQGFENLERGSLNLDTSGHLRSGYSASANHLLGLADRRIYSTLQLRPLGPRIFCDIAFWAAHATGARPIGEKTIWLK